MNKSKMSKILIIIVSFIIIMLLIIFAYYYSKTAGQFDYRIIPSCTEETVHIEGKGGAVHVKYPVAVYLNRRVKVEFKERGFKLLLKAVTRDPLKKTGVVKSKNCRIIDASIKGLKKGSYEIILMTDEKTEQIFSFSVNETSLEKIQFVPRLPPKEHWMGRPFVPNDE